MLELLELSIWIHAIECTFKRLNNMIIIVYMDCVSTITIVLSLPVNNSAFFALNKCNNCLICHYLKLQVKSLLYKCSKINNCLNHIRINEFANSGKEVPKATTVWEMTSLSKFRTLLIVVIPSVVYFAPSQTPKILRPNRLYCFQFKGIIFLNY